MVVTSFQLPYVLDAESILSICLWEKFTIKRNVPNKLPEDSNKLRKVPNKLRKVPNKLEKFLKISKVPKN